MKTIPVTPAEENHVDGKLPPVADPLLEKMKNLFLEEYSPTNVYQPGSTVLMSTREIHSRFTDLYPDEFAFSQAEMARFLDEKGFTVKNIGELRWEWMLQPCEE